MRAWVNGELREDANAPLIAVTDHGFTVGDGVFEAIKVVDSQPFAVTRHLDRLMCSAEVLGLAPPDPQVVRDAIAVVLAEEPMNLGRVRVTYTGGISPLGSNRGAAPPTLVVVAAEMVPWPESTSLVTVPWPRNERGALAGVKTTSYAENVVALAYATERGASEALFLTTQGNLCEGTGSNIFYVVEGEVRTPSLASGCLAGVTRALILEWAGGREVDENASVLARASEVFLASTTRDVQGVHLLDGRAYEAPGPVTQEVMRIWRKREAEGLDP
jgi:branched-chain amino acid aminotransferase